ncbi:hypothetical protein AcW1_002461 [Taiwanofungus camphoratus]|nr:hypothetical protein AcW1_002461 [Antrodia cinnamomea]
MWWVIDAEHGMKRGIEELERTKEDESGEGRKKKVHLDVENMLEVSGEDGREEMEVDELMDDEERQHRVQEKRPAHADSTPPPPASVAPPLCKHKGILKAFILVMQDEEQGRSPHWRSRTWSQSWSRLVTRSEDGRGGRKLGATLIQIGISDPIRCLEREGLTTIEGGEVLWSI